MGRSLTPERVAATANRLEALGATPGSWFVRPHSDHFEVSGELMEKLLDLAERSEHVVPS